MLQCLGWNGSNLISSTCDTDPTLRGKHKSEQSWGFLYILHVWDPAMPRECQIRMIKYVSYLATGLNLLLRLLLLWLLGNHGGCHILACILRAHWLLMEEWKKNEEHFREQVVASTLVLTDLTADGWPSLWRHLHGGDRLAAWCTPVTLNLHLWRWEGQRRAVNNHAELKPWFCTDLLTYRWGRTPQCERICVSCEMTPKVSDCGWSGREPPLGWRCWAGTRSLNPGIAAMVRGHMSSIQHRFHRSSWKSLTFFAVISAWDSSIPSSLRCSALTSA